MEKQQINGRRMRGNHKPECWNTAVANCFYNIGRLRCDSEANMHQLWEPLCCTQQVEIELFLITFWMK